MSYVTHARQLGTILAPHAMIFLIGQMDLLEEIGVEE